MANNKIDIPGFIRDPETGRYFRENPADMGNSSLKKIKLEVKAKTAPKVRPSKIKNVSNFLRMRDIGSFNGVVAESEYCKMMVKNKKEVFSEKMNVTLNLDEQCSMESVEFIIGSEKANIGLWNHKIGSQHKYIVMERNFFNAQDHRSMNYKTTKYNIIDMCEAPNDILVCIYNNFVHNTTSIHCFAKHYEDDSLIFRKGAFYCCSAVGNGIAYAAGGENCIKLFNVNDVDESLHLKGRVHTLSSDKDGKLLAAGLHDGRIRLYDVNTKKVTTEITGLDTCIVESAFRESTPYAIFAGLPDKLFEVDLRTNKVVTIYSEHWQTPVKRHFSMSHNMLCATGSDNIIRIWHTSGGSPIFQMQPIMNRENNIRGWLNADCNKTYLNYYEADCNKVFQLI